jgi:hypothetical protein
MFWINIVKGRGVKIPLHNTLLEVELLLLLFYKGLLKERYKGDRSDRKTRNKT